MTEGSVKIYTNRHLSQFSVDLQVNLDSKKPPGWAWPGGGEHLFTVQKAIQMGRGFHGPHQVVSQDLRWVRQARNDVCPVKKKGEDLAATYWCKEASSSSNAQQDVGNSGKEDQDLQA